MSPRRRFGKKLVKSLLPIVLVLVVALVFALAAIVFGIVRPPRRAYLVTPQNFSQFSGPVLKVTDESWANSDGTRARGWLLRGAQDGPAVIFLHRYGADRSWLFNMGVKLNETSNFTILWPDLRGHGLTPPVNYTTFGTKESEDVLSAIAYLRSLKGERGGQLVGDKIGLYGVELGAYSALAATPRDTKIGALALDSIPSSPDELLRAKVREDFGLDNSMLVTLARTGTKIFLMGNYQTRASCEIASSLQSPRILLLSGSDAGYLRDSSVALQKCFQNAANVEAITDLPLTGFAIASAPGEAGEVYDRRVIDFFDRNLR
jgi:pimeloyl-ACP methyl ester carboxylesterase